MSQDQSTPPPRPEDLPGGRRLGSWKEIAAYLRRGVTTVQRWEKSEGLPVRRLVHSRSGSVWADPGEIDEWWAHRGVQIQKDEKASRPRRTWWLALSLGGVALLGAIFMLTGRQRQGHSAPPGRVMVAVLPFGGRGESEAPDAVCDSLVEQTIAELARIRPDRLGVIARTSAMQYRRPRKSVREIARELDVEYVLEGDVRRTATNVRVDVRLIRAADQSQLFAETYTHGPGDAAAIEVEIARRVAKSLVIELLPFEEARLDRSPRRDPRALLAYLKGLELLNQRTGADIYSAVTSFDQVVRLEPTYAPAFAARGLAYVLLPTYGEFLPQQYYPRARADAEKALELDPTLAEGHAVLGVVAHEYEWDHERAEREYREALRLNASSVLGHQAYAELLTHSGRFDEALGHVHEARRLDPQSRIANALVGWVLYYARRYDEAIEHLRRVTAADPDFIPAHSYLGWAYDRKGMTAEAKAEYDRVRNLLEDNTPPFNWDAGNGGRQFEDLEARASKGSFSGYELACLYAAAGRKSDALRWLAAASTNRDPSVLAMGVEPELDSLRADPRFQELLRKVGLTKVSYRRP